MGGSFLPYITTLTSFGNHRQCNCGDKFLICHMTSHDQMFKGLHKFMGGSASW